MQVDSEIISILLREKKHNQTKKPQMKGMKSIPRRQQLMASVQKSGINSPWQTSQ